MKEEKYQKMKEIVGSYEPLVLRESSSGKGFCFPVYLRERYKDMDVDVLDLSRRASNCLKRAGYKSLYDLISKVRCRADLHNIRGCGDNTKSEIMESIFVFCYNELTPEERKDYILKIIEKNY